MKYPDKESATLEFKREIPKNDQIFKTVIAFANRHGGKIIIGVDNDGTIVGVEESKIEQILEFLDKAIYDNCRPTIIPRIYAQNIAKKTVIIIEVSSGFNKPYFLAHESIEKGTYVRLGRSTMLATPDLLLELKFEGRNVSYDLTPVHSASRKDLDFEKIETFLDNRLQKGLQKRASTALEEALFAYNILIIEHGQEFPTVAGILLFGKDPQKYFPEAYMVATHFSTNQLGEALATRDFTGTLFEQFHDAFDFVISRLNYSYTFKYPLRVETLEIPDVALRETMINAIVHRNYLFRSSIKVAIFTDRIEVWSPGDFFGPLTQNNLRQGFSYIRNLAISKIFREMGYIEKAGSGFPKIFSSYEERKLPEPKVIEGEGFIKVVLPRPSAQQQISVAGENDEQTDEQTKVKELFDQKSKIGISDIMKELNLPRATAGRRLAQWVDEGYLKKIGEKRAAYYVLKK